MGQPKQMDLNTVPQLQCPAQTVPRLGPLKTATASAEDAGGDGSDEEEVEIDMQAMKAIRNKMVRSRRLEGRVHFYWWQRTSN